MYGLGQAIAAALILPREPMICPGVGGNRRAIPLIYTCPKYWSCAMLRKRATLPTGASKAEVQYFDAGAGATLEKIVVTGQKRERKLIELPINRGDPMKRVRRITTASAVAVAIIASPSQASAQNAANATPGDLGAASSVADHKLEEVIVTAQKRAERLQDVPISISVLSGEHLDASALSGALEELNKIPAVATLPAPDGRASTIIRGVAPQAGASPVGYYVDSAPLTFLTIAAAPDVDIYDLERIEILKGPQGTGYGIGSSSGVARILTRDPDLSNFEAKGRVSVSSTDGGEINYRTDAAVNAPVIPDRLAFRGVVGLQNWGGWIDRPNKENFNDADVTNIRFKIGAQLTDDLSAVAGVWHSKRRFGPATSDDNAFRDVLYDEATDASTDVYSFVLKKDFSTFSLSSATTYIDMYSTLLKRSIFTTVGNALNDIWSTHAVSEEIVLTSNGTGPWKWNAGVFYRSAGEHYRLRQTSPIGTIHTAPFVVDDFVGADSYAVFSEVTYALSQFEVLAGLRYSKEERDYRSGLPSVTYATEGTFTKVTPRLVLSWKPGDNATTYVSYSEGFRSGITQGQAASERGFGPVKSDLLHNYELGSKASAFGGALSWEAAVYYMDWEDVQQNLTFPFGGTFIAAFVNAGSASGYGGEVTVTLRPARGFQFGGSYSWNDLTVDADVVSGGVVLYRKGDRLTLSPESTYGAFADYTFPFGSDLEFRIGATVSHVSSQFLRFLLGSVTDIPSEPTTVASLDVGIGRRDGSSRVSIFVENLTNEDGPVNNNYAAATPPIGNIDEGVRLRPRTVGLQFEMKF